MRVDRRGVRRAGRVGLVVAAVAAAGCAGLSPPPQGVPSGKEGWLRYDVAGLRLEAPAGWAPSGDARRLRLEREDGGARLEVSSPEETFAGEAACLEDAAALMKRGDEGLERTRSHPTKFAGRRALSLEGDRSGWHVWAWAACDGGVQYRVFLTARTPATPDVVETIRALVSGARIGGEV
jgi:hypothetical protein